MTLFLSINWDKKIKSLTKLFNSKVKERDDDDAVQNISIMRLVSNLKVLKVKTICTASYCFYPESQVTFRFKDYL